MTGTDRHEQHAGYWPSPWPVECGGNRRQKAANGRLDAARGTATVTTVRNDRWNVMVVRRDPGEWFLGGTMAAFVGPPPFGWVQRIDPETLAPLASSPELPCGEHVWCGAILAHRDGSIVSVNGSYVHRLDPTDCSVLAERRLPVDRAHNGLLALSDGTLVTKDLRLEGQGGTTLTWLEPDRLEVLGTLQLPEGSMGRIAADVTADGVEHVYVPGTEHLWRVALVDGELVVDDWQPRYRTAADRWGLAWDACLSAGSCWLMDCGDVESVRRIHERVPNGRFDATPPAGSSGAPPAGAGVAPRPGPGRALSWRLPAPWPGAQRLLRVALDGTPSVDVIEPFGVPGGGIIAPPVHVAEYDMAIAWDSVNGGLAGVRTGGAELEVAWQLPVRVSMQPLVYPDSGELVVNDFTDDGSDDLVVVDVATGAELDRVPTGSRIANGMFLTPGDDRDVYYCTTAYVARVQWR